MKKFRIITIIVVIGSLIWMNFQQQNIETLPDWTVISNKITNTRNVDLNDFIAMYNSWSFNEVKLINSRRLEWYIKTWERDLSSSLMLSLVQNIKEVQYVVYKSYKPEETTLNEMWFDLTWDTKINIVYEESSMLTRMLETMIPLFLILLLFILLFKFLWPKSGWFPFWAQAWQLQSKDKLKAKFKDVAWMDETKWELEEIVDYLKNPTKYKQVWAKIPRWVLLYWPPGSGKTLLARAVAWEAWVPFFTASWSEFMEMLVGMWAAKVRDLFKKAREAAPCIVFIDEIDTIGKKRWMGATWWHQEQEQTLNQILTEMDWFDKDTNVIVLAATNRPDMLDKALMRPGRFDRKVYVWNPTLEERIDILKIHTQNKKLDKKIDLDSIARRTSWFVWADMENLANEAALKTAKDWRKIITEEDFEYALEKIVMWPEKKIKTLKEKERKIITYHELWHAITAYRLPNADPVEKISIVSRWMALWVTWMMPKEDSYLYSKAKFKDELVTLLWWRAAEEIIFWIDEITTWASNDMEKVTKIATDMLMKYWMDEEIWTISYSSKENKEYQMFRPYSEEITKKIDDKIQWLVKEAYNKAINILNNDRDLMEVLAKVLLEKEYLTKEEFSSIMEDRSAADEILKDFEDKKNKKQSEEEEEKKQKKKNNNETENKDELENWELKKDKKNKKQQKKEALKNMLDKFLK